MKRLMKKESYNDKVEVYFNDELVYETNDLVEAYDFIEKEYGVTEEDWENNSISFPYGGSKYEVPNKKIEIVREI